MTNEGKEQVGRSPLRGSRAQASPEAPCSTGSSPSVSPANAVPGPYWLHITENGEHQIKGRNGVILCRYAADQGTMANAHCARLQREHSAADARLRRVAPALFDALDLLLSYEPGGNPPMTMPRGLAIDQARAALAKARGEA